MAFSMAWPEDAVQGDQDEEQARGLLAAFRAELYRCMGKRRDCLFELADAVLCGQARVHMLAELSLEPECRRGHGAVYDAVNAGRVDIARLRWSLACLPLPAWEDGRIRLAVDVSNWLRPDAETSPGRLFCHCYARGRGNAQMIPGWPYSLAAALEPGRTSWTRPLDAVRLGPADDPTEVTAAQVRDVVQALIAAGHWHDGDPDILVVFDAGYDLTKLAWLLRDLPVEVLGRLRSDRVMYFPAPVREPGTNGRPARHGAALKLADPGTWPGPAAATVTQTARYGTARASAWARLHQQLAARAGWEDHDGKLPVVEGTLIRLQVEHLPGNRSPDPLWLWSSRAGATADEVNRCWQAFLRASISNTCSGSSSRSSAGPAPNSATPLPPNGGPGSSWPPIPSCGSPAAWPTISACPGSGPARRDGSPPPGSAAGSAASTRHCLVPPARRNPANPAPAARPAARTATRPPATTSARPSSETSPRRKATGRRLK